MKKLGYAVLALLLLVVAGLGGTRWYMGRAEPDPGRDAALAGLGAPVEVWRDSLAVPHVWARSEADLFRAMGYVHAQDRLWQMELFRRVADGRMAEILGPDLVDTDRFLRTVGMGRAAAEDERMLDPRARALLQAYADGVNAWMRGNPGPLPPEFMVLRFRPEPWKVRNTLSIAKIMAWDLAGWELDLELQRAVDAVGPELGRDLLPAYPDSGITIMEDVAVAPAAAPAAPRVSGMPIPSIPPLAAALLDGASAARASNAWVIGGSRTRSGKPILANDMHLALRAPALWYLAALHGGGLNVAGMTLPGVPVVIAGHNDRVAWGFTNAMVDDVDFFIEETDPADSTRYRTERGSEPFIVRHDTIRVKGEAPVVHRVRATRHGPVLSDVEKRSGGRVLAMKWTALDPSREVSAFFGMNRARNAAEFVAAMHDFRTPHQNVVFADVEGAFGYQMGGRVPVRRNGGGVLPARGWTGEGEWTRYLEISEHPRQFNPSRGYIVTANNLQSRVLHARIGTEYVGPARAERITQMVREGGRMTAADVARQQMDVRDLFALRHLPLAIRAAGLARDTAAARTLRTWDGSATLDSRAAPLFYTWFDALRKLVGDDEFRGKPPYFGRGTLDRLLAHGGGAWVDDIRTPKRETLDELSAEAMRQAVRTVAGRSWGEMHSTRMDHPMGVVSALDRAFGLNIGPFPSPGSSNTVNALGLGRRQAPYVNSYGPSQRHVVDMARVDDEGGFIIPTGQSGIPTSRHYRDQTPLWREGRLWRIPLDRRKAEARTVARLTLRPR
ncbi:MAG TPA: penicillin acylase family protein [Longimicrobium sp.]|jgi:penicillin amidase